MDDITAEHVLNRLSPEGRLHWQVAAQSAVIERLQAQVAELQGQVAALEPDSDG